MLADSAAILQPCAVEIKKVDKVFPSHVRNCLLLQNVEVRMILQPSPQKGYWKISGDRMFGKWKKCCTEL